MRVEGGGVGYDVIGRLMSVLCRNAMIGNISIGGGGGGGGGVFGAGARSAGGAEWGGDV